MNQRKKKNIYPVIVCIAICLLLCQQTIAQTLTPHLPENKWLIQAEEQYAQGHYQMSVQAAQKYLEQTDNTIPTQQAENIDKAKFYLINAQLKLNVLESVDSAKEYINTITNPAYRQRMSLALARYYFQYNQFANAIPYYETIGIANVDNTEIADSKFELAYCYFNCKQFDKADSMFATIKETPGKYYSAGNYYYGLLAYNNADYTNALKSFERIANEKQYHSIVPYYIAEIHYFSGNKVQALEYAQNLLKRPEKLYYDKELQLLAGQCLFEQQLYNEALPRFEYYYSHTDKIRKEELYEIGYCYYRVNDWNNAIDKFKPLSNLQDSLGQTAMYLLGDCYLKTDDRKSARNAFGICADMHFNPGQQEAALLLNAKLSHEMGYNPDAMRNISTLLSSFPDTKYRDEARTLLSNLLVKTNNYEEAFNTLKDVKCLDAGYWQLYQKITYGYAVRYLLNDNTTSADSMLELSLQHPSDKNYEAAAYFWRGDIAYQQHRYSDAITYTETFIQKASILKHVHRISSVATLQHAYTTLGYAAMENKNFVAAQDYFENASHAEGENKSISTNAVLRQADAAFMQKDFAKAITLYDKSIENKISDSDYAYFQKAIIAGVLGNIEDKIALLQSLINITPSSPYSNNARYEIAITYIEHEKYQMGINFLLPLTDPKTARTITPKAWMKLGFAYLQLNNATQAIDAYKHVVTNYPASAERAAAIDALKNLYIESNQPAEYAKFLKANNLLSPDSNAIDSAYYAAAEAMLASGKWAKAIPALEQYLQHFPKGIFSIKAAYYLGESHYMQKEYPEALKEYNKVLQGGWNDFVENSVAKGGAIAFQSGDFKTALNYYEKLRTTAIGSENTIQAYKGLMESNFYLGKFRECENYSDTLLNLLGINEPTHNAAILYKAKSLQLSNKKDEALIVYKQLDTVKNNEAAAEARYHIADLYFQASKMKEAEQAANNAIKDGNGYDYWIVKSYILLADVLVKQKDYFNAKATLQSIVKNTKNTELKQEAAKRLDEVKKTEKKQSKLSDD
jgi:tetratricopeptide (TPR) repeat protein